MISPMKVILTPSFVPNSILKDIQINDCIQHLQHHRFAKIVKKLHTVVYAETVKIASRERGSHALPSKQ